MYTSLAFIAPTLSTTDVFCSVHVLFFQAVNSISIKNKVHFHIIIKGSRCPPSLCE